MVIIVTPHLVKTLNLSQQPLPTDAFIEPNDFEFLLLGNLEGSGSKGKASGALDGEFGYIMP